MEQVGLFLFFLIVGILLVWTSSLQYKEFQDGYDSPWDYEYSNVPLNKGFFFIYGLLMGLMFLYVALSMLGWVNPL